MKKILSLVLVLALVLTSFSFAAADPVTVGQDLKALGVLTGDENGNLNPDQQLTREQAIVVLVRMMGKEADAKATTTASSFKDIKGTFYGPYIAYAELQGWTNGKSAGVFGFGEAATIDEIYAFMLRALGYTVATLPEAVTKAAELKLNTDVTAEAGKPVLRGQVFITMNNTLNTAPKDGKLALVYVLKLKPEPVVPVVVLAVDSVTAINTKQIEVKFNAEVDKTTAETATNYTVGGVAFDKAVLQADNKTVIATMAGETKMTNAGTAAIKVLKNIKDAKGVALAADFSKTIDVVDVTVPAVTKVEAVGAKTLKITFSEPVFDAVGDTTLENDQITVKSGIYTYVVTNAVADYAARTITVTLGTALLEGEVTVKVNAPGMSDAQAIRDFAGLVLIPAELKYTFAKDTTVPTVAIKSINKATKTAVVTFSKPVYGTNVVMYHSVNGTAAYGTAAVTKAEGAAATEWSFVFTNALPSGALNFYLANDSVAANQLTDLYGVKVPNQTFTFTVVADTTAPTVSKVTVNANTSIDILFSEDLDATEKAKLENFEILKPDGTKLTFTIGVADADVAKTVRLMASMADNTTYTVNVKAMKDVAGNALAAAYTAQAAVADNANPTVTDQYVVGTSKIYITFSESMNEAQMLNKANYTVNGATLGTNDTVTLVSAKKVLITKTGLAGDGSDDVIIGAITDLAGKKLTSDSAFSTAVNNIPVATLTFTAEATAVNKLKLTFDKALGSFDASEITVRQADNGNEDPTYAFLAVESNSVNADGVSEVVLVLDNNLTADAKDTTGLETLELFVTAATNTKSTEGVTLTNGAQVAITDTVVPTVSKVVFLSATKIQVIFTEALESDFFAGAGVNGFSVTGGTLTGVLPYATDSATVVLTGTGFTVNTDVAYNGTNGLKDMNTNKLAAFTRTDALTAGAITVVNANGDNAFSVTTNFTAIQVESTDVDMDTVTAGTQATIVINGITYTVTDDNAGNLTIAGTAGTATATEVAGTATFTITLGTNVKTVTMGYSAVTAGDAAATVTVTVAAQ